MFGSLLRAAIGAATLPLDLAADVVTLGGALNDRPEPYTARKTRQIVRNIDDATTAERR